MSVLDTADTIRARYEGAAPQLDPEGFRLFRAAGEITGIRNLWEEFPYGHYPKRAGCQIGPIPGVYEQY